MDTGNIMENQMDALIEQGIQTQKEIYEQAIDLYRRHKLYPKEVIVQRNNLIDTLESVSEILSLLAVSYGIQMEGAPPKNDREDLFGVCDALENSKELIKKYTKNGRFYL